MGTWLRAGSQAIKPVGMLKLLSAISLSRNTAASSKRFLHHRIDLKEAS